MSQTRATQIMEEQLERVTGGQRTIEVNHAYIHEGILFNSAFTSTLTAGATRKITFKTPATKYVHYIPSDIVPSADKVTVNFYESSSGNSGGTAKTAVNRNRLSSATPTVVLTDGATVTTNGTLFHTVWLPGSTGIGQTRAGSAASSAYEWVLKQDTVYTIEIINNSSASNDIWLNFHWYEETLG